MLTLSTRAVPIASPGQLLQCHSWSQKAPWNTTNCSTYTPFLLTANPAVAEYKPDYELRDTEQAPLLHGGGVEAFLRSEVLTYVPDAWCVPGSVKVGYEISFNLHFYKPQPLRPLEKIWADILALERETEGLLEAIIL